MKGKDREELFAKLRRDGVQRTKFTTPLGLYLVQKYLQKLWRRIVLHSAFPNHLIPHLSVLLHTSSLLRYFLPPEYIFGLDEPLDHSKYLSLLQSVIVLVRIPSYAPLSYAIRSIQLNANFLLALIVRAD